METIANSKGRSHQMYAVGIDVSKDVSTVAVIQPFGVMIAEPYKVRHTETDLRKLADYLKKSSR